MTFGGEVKNELCRLEVHKKCCAQAEAYGVLLYCNTFSGDEVRIVTEHEAFAQRLPVLFKKAFRLTFDRLPQGEGKYIFSIQDPGKLETIHQTYGNSVIYFKQSESIENFLTAVGAPLSAMEVMNAKLEKDLRGSVNRRVNCDAANLDKVVEAAQAQMEAIRRLERDKVLEKLPDKLQEAARLRMDHPEDTLSQLAERCDPPVTKSALNHRLRKLVELGQTHEEGKAGRT